MQSKNAGRLELDRPQAVPEWIGPPLGGPTRPCADFAISGLNTEEGHRGTLSSSPAFPRYRHFFERNSPDSARLNHYVWI
jgi:hypothetical protein